MSYLDNWTPKPCVRIAPEGICVLVVGPEQLRLQVDSMTLRKTSELFSEMFGPRWNEDQDNLRAPTPIEVILPEDNAMAMRVLCEIMHCQSLEITQQLSAKEVFEVATQAKKYDCETLLKYRCIGWFKPPKDSNIKDLAYLAGAALLLMESEVFRTITQLMINTHADSFLLLCEDESMLRVLRTQFLWLLDEARNSARLKFMAVILENAKVSTWTCLDRCKWSQDFSTDYLERIKSLKFTPLKIFETSICDLIQIANDLSLPYQGYSPKSPGECDCKHRAYSILSKRFEKPMLIFRAESLGLCLICTKLGIRSAITCQSLHLDDAKNFTVQNKNY